MSVILIDIFISVRIRKRTVIQPAPSRRDDPNVKRQKTLQRQMFILMLASICIFLITSLPLAIYKIMTPRQANIFTMIFEVLTIWTGLTWFQSLNYVVKICFNSL